MVVTLKGHPIHGIPRRSSVRIEALNPHKAGQSRKDTVWEGEATRSISQDLDPGKYVYFVGKKIDENSNDFLRYVGAFYVGMSRKHDFCDLKDWERDPQPDCAECSKTWKRLAGYRPQFSKGRQTVDGLRYSCGYTGCKVDNLTTAFSAVMHEAEHQGIDLLADPDDIVKAMEGGSDVMRVQAAAKATANLPAQGNAAR